jgi:hypothetical protein
MEDTNPSKRAKTDKVECDVDKQETITRENTLGLAWVEAMRRGAQLPWRPSSPKGVTAASLRTIPAAWRLCYMAPMPVTTHNPGSKKKAIFFSGQEGQKKTQWRNPNL